MTTLHKAIELTGAISEAISQDDWESVSKLEEERRQLIDLYYQGTDPVDESLTLELKRLNDDIVLRLVDLQQQTRSQQRDLAQSSKASRAYQENMRY